MLIVIQQFLVMWIFYPLTFECQGSTAAVPLVPSALQEPNPRPSCIPL